MPYPGAGTAAFSQAGCRLTPLAPQAPFHRSPTIDESFDRVLS